MRPVTTALTARKLLAVAGIGLVGLTGLTACTAADSSDGTDAATTAEAAAEETTEAAPVVIQCDYVPAASEPAAGQSIDAPLDMCATGKVDTWDIAVTAVEVDATDTILAADAANKAPGELFTANRCVPIETEKIDGAVIEMALLNSWDVETYTYCASA